ncbi:hypothetical protein JI664_20915 [Rhodobacter sp. NTK016B]|uniref:hypothetical protein n=1 Tax=Rhodobacter sp. NTK016B TaxID=2759676 RepID=UPI001A8D1FD9|nr:hypothetical protein [Rhodobacter sp. NTK016B]MBN8294447.1 hypothetical protein [Rhodobacter sp. NTK016B]
MTTTGVGFGDYQRYLRDRSAVPPASSRTAGRSGIPYSVPPQTAENPNQTPILPPASMPARAPSTVDAIPRRERPAPASGAPLAAPIETQTLAPVQASAAQPAPAQAITAAQPAPMPAPAPAQSGTAFSATPVAGQAPQQGIRDAQTYHADASTPAGAQGAGPAPAQIVTVGSVPPPTESGGPNLMEYALSVPHGPGTEVYRRINPMRWSSWQDNCLRFRNQDAAQRAFLEAGGPDRDRDNLDPDGDGFACWWDPTPLRQAVAHR